MDTIAGEILNLLADAESCRTYFIAETMGRSAGWLAYGAAIAGEASLVISVEDITGKYRGIEEYTDPKTGERCTRPVMVVDEVVRRIVATMLVREQERKEFGVIVLAEGIAEYLPADQLEGVARDDHGHISIAQVNMARLFAKLVSDEYTRVDRQEPQGHTGSSSATRPAAPRPTRSTSCSAASSASVPIARWSRRSSTAS